MNNILKKPYTTIQRIEFVYENNFLKGKKILETDGALYAIEKNQTVENGEIIEDINYQNKLKEERKIIASYSTITPSILERAIYESKNMDFEDAIEFIKNSNQFDIDIKILKIELKNPKIKRQNQPIIKMLNLLGYSDEEIDDLFLCEKLPKKEENNG